MSLCTSFHHYYSCLIAFFFFTAFHTFSSLFKIVFILVLYRGGTEKNVCHTFVQAAMLSELTLIPSSNFINQCSSSLCSYNGVHHYLTDEKKKKH